MWDGRRVRRVQPPTDFPTCFLTNAPYLLGNVSTRVACPTVRTLPNVHAWDEADYRYHGDFEAPGTPAVLTHPAVSCVTLVRTLPHCRR